MNGDSIYTKFDKEKYTLLLISAGLFILGNHVAFLIFDVYEETGELLSALSGMIKRLLVSFVPLTNYFKFIDFRLIPILIGLLFALAYWMWYFWNLDKRTNFRIKEEHGSARYGDVEEVTKILSADDELDPYQIIYSKHVSISMDTRKTRLNNNTLTSGGSGSGKTRFHVKPDALNMGCNLIITDPKDTLCKEIGNAFYQNGYDMKYLNLVDFEKSMRYNPLKYIYKPNDILKFVNNLVSSTNKDVKASGDDGFFEKAEIALLTACIFFLFATTEESPERRNINNLMDMIDMADASEEDENATSQLDDMFMAFEDDIKESVRTGEMTPIEYKNSYGFLAIRQYGLYKKAAGKTAKSILVSVGVRMGVFNLPEMYELLKYDEMNLETIGNPNPQPKYDSKHNHLEDGKGNLLYVDVNGNDCHIEYRVKNKPVKKGPFGYTDKNGYEYDEDMVDKLWVDQYGNATKPALQKTVLFVAISDADSTFNFLASIIYQQLFDLLYRQADSTEGGSLPIHTRFILDEFANIAKINDFNLKIATMRSRNISVDVILQNLAQIKAVYKDSWETIEGNCDVTLFLGGKEYSTLERLSKIIGNTTIDYRSVSESKGGSGGGSWSVSNQLINRALMAPDEIGRLPSDECLVLIRGQQVIRDKKYELMDHPNIKFTADYDKKNMFDTTKFREFVTAVVEFEEDTYESLFGIWEEDSEENETFYGDENILEDFDNNTCVDVSESELYGF